MTFTQRALTTTAALVLPLGVAACGDSADIAEPEITAATTAAEDGSEDSSTKTAPESTTVTTVYETVEEESPAGSKGPCEGKSLDEAAPGEEFLRYCDGEWASGGVANSGGFGYMRWDGSEWVGIEPDGRDTNGFACYDVDKWKQAGAPWEITIDMAECS